jgi:hypothetical protein
VAGVRDQPALPVLAGGERGEHPVERQRERRHLVVGALDRDGVEPLGAGDLLDRAAQPSYRTEPLHGHRPPGERRRDDPDEPGHREHEAEPLQRLVRRRQRLGKDQRRLAVAARHGRDPVALPLDPVGAVGDVPAACRHVHVDLVDLDVPRHVGGAHPDHAAVGQDHGEAHLRRGEHPVGLLLVDEVVERDAGEHPRAVCQRVVDRRDELVPHPDVRRDGRERDRQPDGHRGQQRDSGGEAPAEPHQPSFST